METLNLIDGYRAELLRSDGIYCISKNGIMVFNCVVSNNLPLNKVAIAGLLNEMVAVYKQGEKNGYKQGTIDQQKSVFVALGWDPDKIRIES